VLAGTLSTVPSLADTYSFETLGALF
jgi:hypothetical protein